MVRRTLFGDSVLLHGPPKVGKTVLAASFPRPVAFIATDPGHGFLPKRKDISVYRVRSLDDLEAIAKKDWTKPGPSGKRYRTVVLDTVSRYHDYIRDGVCARHNVTHPSEAGKFSMTIWSIINDTFIRLLAGIMNQVQDANAVMLLIAHTESQEVELTGYTVEKQAVALTGKAGRFAMGAVSHIWFLGYGTREDKESIDHRAAALDFQDSRMLVLSGGNLIQTGSQDYDQDVGTICPLVKPDLRKPNSTEGGYNQIVKEIGYE